LPIKQIKGDKVSCTTGAITDIGTHKVCESNV